MMIAARVEATELDVPVIVVVRCRKNTNRIAIDAPESLRADHEWVSCARNALMGVCCKLFQVQMSLASSMNQGFFRLG
jgi:N-glycosylase/DNA lyase